MLLDGNPKGYEVAEHIATKVEVNTRMLSTFKNAKSILKHETRGFRSPGFTHHFSMRIDFDNFKLKIVKIVASLIG